MLGISVRSFESGWCLVFREFLEFRDMLGTRVMLEITVVANHGDVGNQIGCGNISVGNEDGVGSR